MLKTAARFASLIVVSLCLVIPAAAWDETGHKISAYIAWQQMTPEVREKVIKLLLAAPEDAQLSILSATLSSRSEVRIIIMATGTMQTRSGSGRTVRRSSSKVMRIVALLCRN